MSPLLDPHTLLVIAHLLGVAFGVGGAFTGDALFFQSVRDRRISRSEVDMLGVASRIVWIGLVLLILSGVGLVWLRPDIFLHSQKFWAKMTVVGVLAINGLVFHAIHRPLLRRIIDMPFSPDHELIQKRTRILMSGAISVVSWIYALILGTFGRLPFAYWQYVLVYGIALVAAIGIALLLRNRILPPQSGA